MQLTPCGYNDTYNTTRWCCGQNSSSCCSNWEGHPDAVTIPLVLGSISTTSNASYPANITTISLISNSGLSKGAKAGIGVGAGLGAVALFGLGYLAACVIRRRQSGAQFWDQKAILVRTQHKDQPINTEPELPEVATAPPSSIAVHEASSTPFVELPHK